MADEQPEARTRDDAMRDSVRYGTFWLTSFFDTSRAAFKWTFQGINIRIGASQLFWGVIGGILSIVLMIVTYLIVPIAPLVIPIGLAFTVGIVLGFAKIGAWSPMADSTGEGMNEYLLFVLRRRIARGGLWSAPVSKTPVKTFASGGVDGEIVEAERWLGTQPLRHVPRGNVYEEESFTPLTLYVQGEYRPVHDD